LLCLSHLRGEPAGGTDPSQGNARNFSLGGLRPLARRRSRGRMLPGCAVPFAVDAGGVTLSSWELWACAATVLRQHGERAPTFVAERLGALALAGDTAGVATWKVIAARLQELSAGGPQQ
jgi:hypothetical protein